MNALKANLILAYFSRKNRKKSISRDGNTVVIVEYCSSSVRFTNSDAGGDSFVGEWVIMFIINLNPSGLDVYLIGACFARRQCW